MNEVLIVFSLSLAMLIGSYVSGLIPMAVHLAEDRLKTLTVLGAGLLVGTALSVIIPEGVVAMFGDIDDIEHDHDIIKAARIERVSSQTKAHNESGLHHHLVERHSIIGITLVAGFIFMLVVDHIGGNIHSHNVSQAATERPPNKITATLGLVVHAAADGIALGSAMTLSEINITVIVFLAIMLHKTPAAFGLVSFLMLEGLNHSKICKHLAAFSFAAPVLTIITYFGLNQQNKIAVSDMQTTGIAMLFSAGTFLYVATVHVLPEVAIIHVHHKNLDGTITIKDQKGFTHYELLVLIVGTCLPLLIALGHEH